MKICFATNNQNKLKEIKLAVKEHEIVSLKDVSCFEELPETQKTLEGNSSQKAFYLYDNYKENCFADDTGLEVGVLGGAPGVYSARYGGKHGDSEANMDLLLSNLKNELNRKAQFRTVITLVINGEETQFEGVVKGEMTLERQGGDGFGYDPIFVPEGYTESFAQMTMAQKNEISHRGLAVKKLVAYLNSL